MTSKETPASTDFRTLALSPASVADAVAAALVAIDAPATGRATGYDPELGFDAVILTVMWLTG